MEEKKFDPYQFIGFILIALILTWMLYRNGPAEAKAGSQSTVTEQPVSQPNNAAVSAVENDSLVRHQKVAAYGDLGSLFSATGQSHVRFETEQMKGELNPQGGQLSQLILTA